MHLLHHRHHVDDVPTAAANLVGEAEADQAEIPGEAVQRARELPVSFPVAEVIEDLTFDKAANRPSQLVALRGVKRVGAVGVGCAHSSTSGIET